MTNFDFLKDIPQFAAFADVAVAAEKILMIDPEASVMNCRRAMEFAVKWMYSVDDMQTFCGEWILFAGWQIRWHIREES